MNVGFFLFDNALALDIAGPAEVFAAANRLRRSGEAYALSYWSPRGGPVVTASGMIIDTQPIAACTPDALSTLIVSGGIGLDDAARLRALVEPLEPIARGCERVCSVCSGAFILAAAGLLDDRRAVTHWEDVARFKTLFPAVHVETDPIYVQDGHIWTSAGVSAGIDLALALVEQDLGRRVALTVARQLVVFLHRPGGQAQYSKVLTGQIAAESRGATSRLGALSGWIADRLGERLDVERLARHCAMSSRSFARKFAACYGTTPARFVEDLRLEAAIGALEAGRTSIKRIAAETGFGDEERMRRVFHRRLGISPQSFRARFGQCAPSNPPPVSSGTDSTLHIAPA
ncbi:GlxA family transcriptional regulator [Allosphingosinicella deserti]|uniref:AraC family transcriptional regulator n=1 Tax=Allosphingosinicella deserti TaxID=2116704 RepID=A0A2P7QUL7_9SPHN|nr:helix-turn-helix domain-containing protein [Sphingomonas deserti]PSJ41665.1 AraC family transcriptional regulator [Sphingomonas deserti]